MKNLRKDLYLTFEEPFEQILLKGKGVILTVCAYLIDQVMEQNEDEEFLSKKLNKHFEFYDLFEKVSSKMISQNNFSVDHC